jgi:nitrite reductase/ring-hydroxylating ferredoxin subunit
MPNTKFITRREMLITIGLSSLAFTLGCERHRYIRPEAELDLGAVKELLYSMTHVPIKSILVYRDVDGWSALSTRCTYDGCDMTFQEPVLLCPCCRSRFTLDGIPYEGVTATRTLPWVDVYYREGHLYANPGKIKEKKWRFTTPEIEEAIRKLRKEVKREDLDDEVKIPNLLQGEGDKEVGMMFLEEDPNLVQELDMIK